VDIFYSLIPSVEALRRYGIKIMEDSIERSYYFISLEEERSRKLNLILE